MQVINAILGAELNIGSELTEAQMELLCGGYAPGMSEEEVPPSAEVVIDEEAP